MHKTQKLAVSLFAAALLAGATGCGTLIPKKVELFQKKVQALPGKERRLLEHERQAAELTERRADSALRAATSGNAVASILPLQDARAVADALSLSLGPPSDPWDGTAADLAAKLSHERSGYDRNIDSYRDDVQPLEGKKIEGTGLIQVSYFVWVGGIALVLLVVYFVARVLMQALAMSNPGVSVGLNALQMGGAAASRMLAQVLKGGKLFKKDVDALALDPDVKAKVLDMFSRAHDTAQDETTRLAVKTLVKD